MEEAFELTEYLPLSFKTQSEQDYIAFLWDAFETNYASGKHQFAFLAYHMLTMSFVYFNIWQIKQNRPVDFLKATYGFTKDNEDAVLSATSPFTFSEIGESAIFRFLKLIDCDNGKIGTYTKLVKERNATAHSNGVIQYADQKTLDRQIAETLRVVDEIQRHSKCIIEDCYRQFLLESNEPEDREYPDDADQIREVLIHGNYLSQKDIELCAAFDITEHEELEMHHNFPGIESLHQTLCASYSDPEGAATS
jgi:hypothetical protein